MNFPYVFFLISELNSNLSIGIDWITGFAWSADNCANSLTAGIS